jgi:flagellar biosynthesis protein FlhG
MNDSPSKLIIIASGKGGVGKTWVSITLAHALAQKNKKTLLFDGDLGLANIDIQLGLLPDVNLGQVFSGKITLAEAVMSYGEGKAKIDIISGQSGTGALASLKPEKIEAIGQDLQVLSQDYDYSFIDMGAGVETPIMALAKASKNLVIIITADPTSLTDAYAFIKLYRMRQKDSHISIIVNMADDRTIGKKVYVTLKKACENFLKFTPELLGVIRRDSHVIDAVRHQMPLLSRYPTCKAADDIAEILKKL